MPHARPPSLAPDARRRRRLRQPRAQPGRHPDQRRRAPRAHHARHARRARAPLIEVAGTTDDRIARFDQLRTSLLPCFPSDTWRGAADDREFPGWRFASTEPDAPSAELRLADINGVVTLIFRVVSQPGAGKRD